MAGKMCNEAMGGGKGFVVMEVLYILYLNGLISCLKDCCNSTFSVTSPTSLCL